MILHDVYYRDTEYLKNRDGSDVNKRPKNRKDYEPESDQITTSESDEKSTCSHSKDIFTSTTTLNEFFMLWRVRKRVSIPLKAPEAPLFEYVN